MSDRIPEELLAQATAWHLKLDSAAEEDWLAFTDWLEADPSHNRAYDEVLAAEDRFDPLLQSAVFPDPSAQPAAAAPQPLSARPWRWGALAASIAAAVALTVQLMPADSTYTVETPAGETRTLALADGGQIALNGGTRIILDRKDPRRAELLSGEARFDIVHNVSDPYVVAVGDDRLVDVGTVFNIRRDKAVLQVGVSEGSVRYETGSEKVLLNPGDVLVANSAGTTVTRRGVDTIGSWVDGALIYESAPLSQVAVDLARATGVRVRLSEELGRREFSGVIQTDGDTETIAARAAAVLGVNISRSQGEWILEP